MLWRQGNFCFYHHIIAGGKSTFLVNGLARVYGCEGSRRAAMPGGTAYRQWVKMSTTTEVGKLCSGRRRLVPR
jgi:hypothetical protein